jgi:hypothetical protein
MGPNFFAFFGIVMLIVASVHLTMHFYYRNKHKQLISGLQGSDYQIRENAEIDLEYTSRLSAKYYYCRCDVIFTKNSIFILLKNRFTKQCGRVLAFTNSQHSSSFRNVSKSCLFSECYTKDNVLIIKSSGQNSLNFKLNAQIKLTGKINTAELLAKYDLNQEP